jgi:FAD/FMN-containing dehydrogenase
MLTTDQTLSDAISGRVVVAGDPDWDSARQAFNLAIDQRPAAVAFPLNEREVAAVVRHAREHGLRVAAQATGHNAAPLGSLAGTILLHTSMLTAVSIDAGARRVRVGAGTKWEQVVAPLSELGLAALHGSSPDVGIVGYSLGGGGGWLARLYGFQANSVTAIELVTADGDLIRTDAVHEPELFWALRGGGGSFGIVTAIEFEVYPLEELYAGAMFFPFERAAEILKAWTALHPSLPDEITSSAVMLHVPDLPFVPEPIRGGSFAVVIAAFVGGEGDGARLLAPIRELGPVMDTFAMVPPLALAELAMDPPDPLPYLSAHHNVGELSHATLEQFAAACGRQTGLIAVQLRQLGGAMARAPEGAGARATLDGTFAMFAVGVAPDAVAAAHLQRSLQAVKASLVADEVSEYPSFAEAPADASAFYEPRTWARLREVKALYDPSDVIRGNHHIPPAR